MEKRFQTACSSPANEKGNNYAINTSGERADDGRKNETSVRRRVRVPLPREELEGVRREEVTPTGGDAHREGVTGVR